MAEIRSICVYCGSSDGNNAAHKHHAEILGKALADAKIRLVYGGGNRGIMGAVARATIDNGGEVLGIIPKFLVKHEWHKDGIDNLGGVMPS